VQQCCAMCYDTPLPEQRCANIPRVGKTENQEKISCREFWCWAVEGCGSASGAARQRRTAQRSTVAPCAVSCHAISKGRSREAKIFLLGVWMFGSRGMWERVWCSNAASHSAAQLGCTVCGQLSCALQWKAA
jgi:hypothetical protein